RRRRRAVASAGRTNHKQRTTNRRAALEAALLLFCKCLLSLSDGDELAVAVAGVDLAGAEDAVAGVPLLAQVRRPAERPRGGEHRREEVDRDADGGEHAA